MTNIRTSHFLSSLLCALGAALVLGQQGAVTTLAQQLTSQALGDGLELFQLKPSFYVLAGAGAHVGVQVGNDGAVVVGAGDAAHADRLAAELKKLLGARPIRYVINTNSEPDYVGGNAQVAKIGRSLLVAGPGLGGAMTNDGAAAILAQENVLLRMSVAKGDTPAYPSAAWPTEAFAQPRKYMYLNDEGIEVIHQPAAHSDGDSIVFFRKSDVVMAGEIIDYRRFPVIDVAHGGTINGEIAALNRLVELAIPSVPIISREAGTVVVPGHGRLLDQLDVVEYRDMVTIVRDRVAHLRKQGKSLAEVKAAEPTQGFTTRFGSTTGPWTTEMFVEAVFNTLPASATQPTSRASTPRRR